MKILNRKEFLALPSGILYSFYSPCVFDGLFIKGSSLGDVDWVELDLIDNVKHDTPNGSDTYDILEKSKNEGTSFEIDYEGTCRNGMFEEEQLFAVYEKEDLSKLMIELNELLVHYPKEIKESQSVNK